jgi:Ca-activated chloride channel family protein
VTATALAAFAVPAGHASAQTALPADHSLSSIAVPANRAFILPQSRVFAADRPSPIRITEVTAGVVIVEQAATTTLDIALANPSGARVEAELLVPVPDGAAVRGFSFQGNAAEATAQVLATDEARATYNAIVAKIRDPALLEFAGYNLIRSSVFPVEANGTQKVRLTYEHLLTADGDRVDYVLPRSESIDYNVPWKVSIRINSKRSISTVYSPSHRLETVQRQPNIVSVRLAGGAATEPGPLRVSYLLERNGITASLLAYPDPKVGGGYFLLLAGLPARLSEGGSESAIKRDITLVFDRSGSMNGQKIEQVRQAALQIIEGLEDEEAFNIITYNDTVDLFSPKSVAKTQTSVRAARAYLEGINARGGTNIHDALTEALRIKPAAGTLPIVLFLTDGLPTVGQTSEAAIREVATRANPHERRVFTFGVGVDVNTPLLQNIARETRGTSTFVLPTEDVEVKVAGVFKQLTGPVLADAALDIIDASGEPAPQRVREVIPARLPDMFEGDQLVLLGQYVGDDPLNFRVSGNYMGSRRTFRFQFGLDSATTKNAFVPRLWASRRIGTLVDAIRRLGADGNSPSSVRPGAADPRMKELVDEIVRLSTEFGILTEYTAFLAREGTDLSDRDNVMAEANANFQTRAVNTRSGLAAVNQAFNNDDQVMQSCLNVRNGYWDAGMNRVAITNVQQINDRAFYQRNGRWVDSRIVNEERTLRPAKVIEFGSSEFHELARKLASEGRQGSISLRGDILLLVDNEPVLVK